ncbi:MAG: DUF1673 family protein [Candidatus Methanoperedens sp.]|nr:DUF1673 family protein [Candidatus Methanoperedens sp.]
MLVNVVETIKKLMGWCPNVDMAENRKTLQFDSITVNAPGSGGGLTQAALGWSNKYRNRVLQVSVSLTLMAMVFYNSYARNSPEFFLSGLIYGLVFSIFTGVTEWRRLNKAAAGEFRNVRVSRRKKFMSYVIIFGLIIAGIVAIGYYTVKTYVRLGGIYATFTGFILSTWAQYFLVVYWERKNRKMLIQDRTSFYAVDIGDDGLRS